MKTGLSNKDVDTRLLDLLHQVDQCSLSLHSHENCNIQDISERIDRIAQEMTSLSGRIKMASKDRSLIVNGLYNFIDQKIADSRQFIEARTNARAMETLSINPPNPEESRQNLATMVEPDPTPPSSDEFTSTTSTPDIEEIPAPALPKYTRKQVLESQIKFLENQLQTLMYHHQLAQEKEFITENCKTIDSWEIVREVSQGNNGIVVIARCKNPLHPNPQREYALKICYNFEIPSRRVKEALKNEHEIWAKLPYHRNVAGLISYFDDEMNSQVFHYLPPTVRENIFEVINNRRIARRHTHYVLTELAHESLKNFLDRKRSQGISSDEICLMMEEIGEGLIHLQNNKIAHRDIKLNNIVVTLDEKGEILGCKLIDFGNSIKLSPKQIEEEPERVRLNAKIKITECGSLDSSAWGNQAHIAPELHTALRRAQASKSEVEIELDYSHQAVFELGVLGYEITTGQDPLQEYPDAYLDSATNAIVYSDDQIPRIPFAGTEAVLNEQQSHLLYRAISCDPASRPTLQELVAAFAAVPLFQSAFDEMDSTKTETELEAERSLEAMIQELQERIDQVKKEQKQHYEIALMREGCTATTDFEVLTENPIKIIGDRKNEICGGELSVRCKADNHPFPEKVYTLKANLIFGSVTKTAQEDTPLETEVLELGKVPPHPNIVKIFSLFRDEIRDEIRKCLPEKIRPNTIVAQRGRAPRNVSTQYYVTENFQESLSSLLQRLPQYASVESLRLLVGQIGSALLHLEKHHSVHRELTLDNIGVELNDPNRPGEIRFILTNFGKARQLNEDQHSPIDNLDRAQLTYFAPEVITSYEKIFRSLDGNVQNILSSTMRTSPSNLSAYYIDYSKQYVYELGVLIYQFMTGKHPLNITKDQQEYKYPTSYRQSNRDGQRFVQYNDSDIPVIEQLHDFPELQTIIKRAVSCNPEDRPSLEELVRAIST